MAHALLRAEPKLVSALFGAENGLDTSVETALRSACATILKVRVSSASFRARTSAWSFLMLTGFNRSRSRRVRGAQNACKIENPFRPVARWHVARVARTTIAPCQPLWYLSFILMPRFALFLLISASLCSAQDRGAIRGFVTDSAGAAAPGAVVIVKNAATGLTQTARTGVDGVYSVLYLPAGSYTVTAEKTGFRKAEAAGVAVHVATVTSLDVTLTIGALEQTVEVSATAPLLDMQGTNLGKVIPKNAIKDLPLFIGGGLRSNLAFVILTPGVIGPANNPRIGGGLLDGQSEQLDGAEAQSERRNDPAMNGVSVEGMEEFKVHSSSYSAEYGRTSNGVINWVTKSGTNAVHGSGFVFNRNEALNARGFTTAPSKRPIVRQWNPGGSVGGPIFIPKVFDGRNKAFFFFAYERASTRNGQSTALITAPLDEFRNGDFRRNVDSAGRTIPLYDQDVRQVPADPAHRDHRGKRLLF